MLNDISDALPDSVDVEIPKVELTNRDAITASRNDLSSSLTSMGDIVSSLNNNASSNSQALINDVKAISKQINKIGQTLSGASENVNRDADDIVDDVSDDDTDDDVEAKVTNCINSGTVNADLNAGGITGAMARENDLDPEDDYTTAGSESLNFTFKTRVVTRDCTNYGTVSAKKQNAGGIVGDAEMGSVIDCRGFGTSMPRTPPASAAWPVSASPRSARAAPRAACPVQSRSAALSQRCHHRKLPRHGHDRQRCRTDRCDCRYRGRPAGRQRDRQHLRGRGCRGHRQRQLPGIAEPLAYEDFVAQENLPGDFGSICVRFVTDEDSLVQEYHIPYGSDFPTDQLPPVPNHQGQYGSWEDVDLTGMTFDATIHAEYSDINTVRQSQEKRGERSLVLVEAASTPPTS